MNQHERYAERKGYTLIKIQGRMEWWETKDGKPMLYNRDSKRWNKATVTVGRA
jgi:hypothetical protein